MSDAVWTLYNYSDGVQKYKHISNVVDDIPYSLISNMLISLY